ncbi:hypothetical protein BOX15_Mlig016313g1 [Macrostomum lignano]|uniref:Fibronectin type-III domain-containing protein n=2 Tax=Macrostomum lignano TaxID=282301 RepID=A0A1I8HZ78_9PLAT|nr:hypothetical protein BOX15_Mlig016313g1 [Macrostomum lignano]
MSMRPPKPQGPLQVDKATHHSLELNWEAQLQQSAAEQSGEDGRLRVEVQWCRFENTWEVAYKGFDVRCVCAGLEPNQEYQVRIRFGNGHGWGDFSEPVTSKTAAKPFSGEDLHRCIRRRNLDALVNALETGEANPNAPDDKGFTPLAEAALEGLLDYCQALLDHRADVNWSGDNGKTCLMLVAYKGKPEVLQWLLESANASLHPRDRNGLSALHYAVDGEQLDNVRLLLDAGADLHAKDNAGCTPLLRCAQHRNNGNSALAVELLNRGALVDETDSSGQTALFYCVMNRHEKLAAVLLHHGADIRATNSRGLSVLKATDGQQPDRKAMRELLLEHEEKRRSEQQQKSA